MRQQRLPHEITRRTVQELVFVLTCGACPEQYDVYWPAAPDGEMTQVAYLRLRHGHFYVHCPSAGGTEVYAAELEEGAGIFTDQERDYYIAQAAAAIHAWMRPLGQ